MRLAWMVFGFIAPCSWPAWPSVLNATRPNPADSGEIVGHDLLWLAIFCFPVVGMLVASRWPGNAVGWIMLIIGLVWPLASLSENYARLGFVTDPDSLQRPDFVPPLTKSI